MRGSGGYIAATPAYGGRGPAASRERERPVRAVWGVRDGARVLGVADRVSGSCEGGPIWPAPSNSSAAVVGEPRHNCDGRELKCPPLRGRGCRGTGARVNASRGAWGAQGTARHAACSVDTATER